MRLIASIDDPVEARRARSAATDRSGEDHGVQFVWPMSLTGVVRCEHCGGTITGAPRRGVRFYTCMTRRIHGVEACANRLYRPVPTLESEVDARLSDVLGDALLDGAETDIRAAMLARQAAPTIDLDAVRAEIASLRRKVRSLEEAIEDEDDRTQRRVLASTRREYVARIEVLEGQIRQQASRVDPEEMIAEVLRRLRHRVGDLREALAGAGEAVRGALRQIFPDGMTARMDRRRWILDGSGSVTSGTPTDGARA